MYTQQRKLAGDVYIPPNYSGNALYFDTPSCECEEEGAEKCSDGRDGFCKDGCDDRRGDSCENSCANRCEGKCKKPCRDTYGQGLLGTLSSSLGKLFSGDNIILLALLAFFLFSGKEKNDDNTMLLLILLLLF